MNYRRISRVWIWLALGGIFLLTSSCTPTNQPTSSPMANLYSLDPVLREFYDYMGGETLLGPIISKAKHSGGITSQYTTNSLLIFDMQAPDTRRFQFGSLGEQLNIVPSAGENLEIAEPFQEICQRLGPIFTGKPLTGLIYNQEKEQYEQYFENLGFYKGKAPGSSVGLLPYGAWTCGQECLQESFDTADPESQATIQPSPTPAQAGVDSNSIKPPFSATGQWILQAWKKLPTLKPDQKQEFGLKIQLDDQPVEGVVARIAIELPDGTALQKEFPATDKEGNTSLEIDSLISLLNGSTESGVSPIEPDKLNGILIPYQVCLTGRSGEEFCLRDSYLIWEQP